MAAADGGLHLEIAAMALNKTQLSKASNLNSIENADGSRQVWYYDTADAVGTVTGTGYFNDVRGYLRAGDVIHLTAGSNAYRLLKVNAVPKTGNVTIGAYAFS